MDAIKALRTLQQALSDDPVEDAAEKLGDFLKWNQVVDVYAAIWPRLYKFDWNKGIGIWEVIQSFFDRLGRYFPLMDISMESQEDLLEWASATIPYELANPFDPEGRDDWGSLAARVFADFYNPEGDGWADLKQAAGREVKGPGIFPSGRPFNSEKFTQRIEALRGGKGFLKAFELVRHDTGFMLLDMTYDEYGDICDEWDVETVKEAIETGKEMNRFIKKALRAIRFLDANPKKLADWVERAARISRECTGEEEI